MFEALRTELELLGYSKKTIEIYIYYNQDFLNFIKKEPKYVSSSDIRKYLLYNIGKKARTINLIISALKFYYDRIYHKKLFYSINRMKQEKRIPIVLSKDEIKRMIAAANLKHRILIELLYGSGLRAGECVNLKVEDINLNDGYGIIREGKGKKDRYIILSDNLIKDLGVYLRIRKIDSPYIFNTEKGNYSTRTAEKIIKLVAKKAGIKGRVFPHALRSSFATHLIDNGIDISKIQSLLGHSRIDTTRNYIKTSVKDLKEIKSPLDM